MNKRFFSVVLSALLLACCTEHDPRYENVTKPVVKAASSVISGVVTDFKGNPLSGALVSIGGRKVETDNTGLYSYAVESAGNYEIKATFSDRVSGDKTVAVASIATTQIHTCNFLLPTQTSVVLGPKNLEGKIYPESVRGTEVYGTVEISAVISEEQNVFPENLKLTLSPVYSARNGGPSPSGGSAALSCKQLVGFNLKCSDSGVSTLPCPVNVSVKVGPEVCRCSRLMYYSTKSKSWQEVPYTEEGEYMQIVVTSPGEYGIFADVSVTTTPVRSSISFDPYRWDNLYGSAPFALTEAPYQYAVGTAYESTQASNRLKALLLGRLVQDCGSVSSFSADCTYPLNSSLPIGTALEISGTQDFIQTVYSFSDGASVSAILCSTCAVSTQGFNRVTPGI